MSDTPFTKENMDQYLKELAKEFRKRNGKNVPAEIILIGGAAILINYNYSSYDGRFTSGVCRTATARITPYNPA